MTDIIIQDSFRRQQAIKSRFSGHCYYGYSRRFGVKEPRTNISSNQFASCYRRRHATEWQPMQMAEHPRPAEIMCYAIYHLHFGLLPNYGGHVPGARFRYGRTFGRDTLDAKRSLRGDFRPN